MISKKFKAVVKLHQKRNYEIAYEAGIHPATLSKILCGIQKVNLGDWRVIAIGKVIGLRPDQCFETKDKQ